MSQTKCDIYKTFLLDVIGREISSLPIQANGWDINDEEQFLRYHLGYPNNILVKNIEELRECIIRYLDKSIYWEKLNVKGSPYYAKLTIYHALGVISKQLDDKLDPNVIFKMFEIIKKSEKENK